MGWDGQHSLLILQLSTDSGSGSNHFKEAQPGIGTGTLQFGSEEGVDRERAVDAPQWISPLGVIGSILKQILLEAPPSCSIFNEAVSDGRVGRGCLSQCEGKTPIPQGATIGSESGGEGDTPDNQTNETTSSQTSSESDQRTTVTLSTRSGPMTIERSSLCVSPWIESKPNLLEQTSFRKEGLERDVGSPQ